MWKNLVFSLPFMARETFARQCQYDIFSWMVHLSMETMILRVRDSDGDRGLFSSTRSRAEIAAWHLASRRGAGMR